MKDSEISENLLQCNCTIDFDDFDILPTDASNIWILVNESLLIKPDNPVLNKKTASFPIKKLD